jgi:hypothetical protein
MDVCTSPFEFPVPAVCDVDAHGNAIHSQRNRAVDIPQISTTERGIHVSKGIRVCPLMDKLRQVENWTMWNGDRNGHRTVECVTPIHHIGILQYPPLTTSLMSPLQIINVGIRITVRLLLPSRKTRTETHPRHRNNNNRRDPHGRNRI